MSAEPSKKILGMPKGCFIGCAVVLILAIVAAAVVGGLIYWGIHVAADQMRAALVDEYTACAEEGRIPEEYRAAFDAVYNLGAADDSTMGVVLLSYAATVGALDDGEVSDQDLESLASVKAFLDANPDVGVMAMGSFLGQHPEMQDAVNGLQRPGGAENYQFEYEQEFSTETQD